MPEQEELISEEVEEKEDLTDLDKIPDFKVPDTSEVINNPMVLYYSHYENNRERLKIEEREIISTIKQLKLEYNKYLNAFSEKTYFIQLVEKLLKSIERQLWLKEVEFKTANDFAERANQINRDYFKRDLSKDEREEMIQYKAKERELQGRDKEYIEKLQEELKNYENDETIAWVRKYTLNPILLKEKYDPSYFANLIRTAGLNNGRIFKDKPKEKAANQELLQKLKEIYKQIYKVQIL